MSGLAGKNTLPLFSLLNNSNEVRCFANIKASPFIELLQEEIIHSITGLPFPTGQRTTQEPIEFTGGLTSATQLGPHLLSGRTEDLEHELRIIKSSL